MDEYSYKKIDAFTSKKSLGNPAACIYLDNGQTLDENRMQAIARQHKGFVSEVVYCSKSSLADYKLGDPATGSGNSAFGYYMLKNKLWNGDSISIEQGSAEMEYNIVKLNTKNDKVLFGGCATDRIIGKYLL